MLLASLMTSILSEQTWSRFKTVLDTKIDGAWNLHALSLSSTLDFFVLYSAGASLFGSPGQGNYAAANAFLDGLAHYRHCLGLPALSINWGRWADVGMASKLSNQDQQRWVALGMNSIKPVQGMQALQQLISNMSFKWRCSRSTGAGSAEDRATAASSHC